MRNDKTGIDIAVFDTFQQGLHVAVYVALTGANGERTIHQRAYRKLVEEAAVHAHYRYCAAITTSHDGLAQRDRPIRFGHHRLLRTVVGVHCAVTVGFHAARVDASIRTAAAGHFFQRIDYADE